MRPAGKRDIDVLSRLFVQLYAHELPGMLRGPTQAQVALVRSMLDGAALGGTYVLEQGQGSVVGMGSLATVEMPRPDTPAWKLLRAPALVGPLNGLRTILSATRGLLSIIDDNIDGDEARIYSFVVDNAYRGQGFGGALLRDLEEDAVRRGKQRVMLQVITSNAPARDFYRSAGYVEAEMRLGRIRSGIAIPSVIMRKDLAPA